MANNDEQRDDSAEVRSIRRSVSPNRRYEHMSRTSRRRFLQAAATTSAVVGFSTPSIAHDH
ncbi:MULTISPECIES: twin-arginine translocation signal domain-containing protein [Natrialbaceae]|uniref:twin-arginine translocation signal domain-containing protein n=1 Tax=Natrialbaceae TaxID=1644061 RepID=UPI003622B189